MLFKSIVTCLAASVVGMLAFSARADCILNLDIQFTPDASLAALSGTSDGSGGNYANMTGEWQAYATISGSTSTLGLGGLTFNVTTTGGISLVDWTDADGFYGTNLDLPVKPGPVSGLAIGFVVLPSTGNHGSTIEAYQSTSNTKASANKDPGLTSILQGVGQIATTVGPNSWAYPVLVADGVYYDNGTHGTIAISSDPSLVTMLPATLPAATTTGAGYMAFTPTSTPGDSKPIGVPEPASLGVLCLGGLALVARRRKVA